MLREFGNRLRVDVALGFTTVALKKRRFYITHFKGEAMGCTHLQEHMSTKFAKGRRLRANSG